MGAVYPPTHDHGFVLHHHSNDNTCLFCFVLFCLFFCLFFVCFDIPSWHYAHGPKTLRMMMMMKTEGRKGKKMVRDHEEKCSLANSGHLIYSGSFILCLFLFFWTHFYIYMHFVFLCCDFSVVFCVLPSLIHTETRGSSPSNLLGTTV